MIMYLANSFEVQYKMRLENRNPVLLEYRKKWEAVLSEAFRAMPEIPLVRNCLTRSMNLDLISHDRLPIITHNLSFYW